MQNIVSSAAGRTLAAFAAALLAISTFGTFVPMASATSGSWDDMVKVTVNKYVDGVQATGANANNAEFPMSATWSAENMGSGTGTFTLGPNTAVPYMATSSKMTEGANYTTNEVTGGSVVGADCTTGQPFSLVGYTSGNTLADAQAATPTTTAPSFTGLTHSKYVIVWNHTCAPPVATTTSHITINKYIDGVQATGANANNAEFPMTASWNDSSATTTQTGTFTLSASSTTAYQATTLELQPGAEYSTNEVTGGSVVATDCTGDQPFSLVGYTTGNTLAEAAAGTPTTTAPTFSNLMGNKYVIVWNHSCSVTGGSTGGTIGGTVTGGAGVLAVTSVDPVDTTANADGTYANGWKYVFNVTVPTNETNVAMKFSDWMSSGSSTIPVANNMRVSSAQSDNATSTPITLTAADTYSTPDMHMVSDLNPSLPGLQVQVVVEVRIPVGTADASYTTNYGVRSQ